MDLNNRSLLEVARPVSAIVPKVVAASGTSNGTYMSLKNCQKLGVEVNTGAGTGVLQINLFQATAVAGTGEKALTIPRADINTAAGTTDLFAKATVQANGTITGVGANTIVLIDVDPDTLDTNNDFDCVKVQVVETGGSANQTVQSSYIQKYARVDSREAAPNSYTD